MANALRLRRKYPISTCRDYSVTCASRLANESMDFVYLDARHDCTLHAASVLGLSLLAPFVTPSHSPAHSTDRLPFPSHVFSPGRQGRSRRPERLLAKAATRWHHGRVLTHSSHIRCPICPLPACGPAPTETRKRCHGLLCPARQPTRTAARAAGTIISGLPKADERAATAETIGRSTLTEHVALLPIKPIHRHGSTSATHRSSLARQERPTLTH